MRLIVKVLAVLILLLVRPVLALEVVADIAPVHSLVAQVMGATGQPILLLGRQDDPHHFALRPSQARALRQADLVIWIGPALTPALTPILASLAPDTGLELLPTAPSLRHYDDDRPNDHDDTHHHGAGDPDPHAWLDPVNAVHWLGIIADRLAQLDPANAAQYRANAARAEATLAALDQQLQTNLAGLVDRPFVVGHDAYGYFTARYGLTVAGMIAGGDAAPPGAARIRQLRADLLAGGAICAFADIDQNPVLLQTVIAGTGVRTGAALDPDGRRLAPGPGLYAQLLQGLAGNIADCLRPDS